jgi:hypothetical protein
VIETFAAIQKIDFLAQKSILLSEAAKALGEGANRDRVDVPNNSSINSQTAFPPVNWLLTLALHYIIVLLMLLCMYTRGRACAIKAGSSKYNDNNGLFGWLETSARSFLIEISCAFRCHRVETWERNENWDTKVVNSVNYSCRNKCTYLNHEWAHTAAVA